MPNFTKLESSIRTCIERDWMAGFAIHIRQADQPPYIHCAGYADRDAKIPVSEDTLFRVMSMAKPMTAVAAMALVERGMLRLQDPVRQYAPCTQWAYGADGAKARLAADNDLTVLHLLNHTSGLGMSDAHQQEIFRAAEGRDHGLAQWAEAISAVPLEFMPGTKTGYSSYAGFTLLGHVLERAAGMPFDQVLNTFLHRPLRMEPPKFWLESGEMPRLSRLYATSPDGLTAVAQSYFPSPYRADVHHLSGAGCVFMSLKDSARFADMLAGEGQLDGARVLQPETARAMATDALAAGLSFGPGVQWGLGMAVYGEESAEPYSPGSFGWGGYYGNRFWVDPSRRLSVTYLYNVIEGHKEEIRRLIERQVYACLDAR